MSVTLVYEPDVRLIAVTHLADLLGRFTDCSGWHTDAPSDGEELIEFAGRQCYESWKNPSGRNNAAYIDHIISVGHSSVLEHAIATFRFAGVSRSWSHEAVRHRHLSVSQLSQRYVDSSQIAFVVPPAIRGDERMEKEFRTICQASLDSYNDLVLDLHQKFAPVEDHTLRRKLAREAARSVLPNCAETRIVLTGNLTAWRWFVKRRATKEADAEMCEVACKVIDLLKEAYPNVFADFMEFRAESDGRRYFFTEREK